MSSTKTTSMIYPSSNHGADSTCTRAVHDEISPSHNKEKVTNGVNHNYTSAYQKLCQECWEELISRLPSAPCSSDTILFSANALTLGIKSVLPLASGLTNSFLRYPLLEHCTQLLYDAFLESQSWSVHSQAALAMLQLASRMIGQPFGAACSNNALSKRSKCNSRPCPKVASEISPGTTENPDSGRSVNETLDADGKQCRHADKCITADADSNAIEVQEILDKKTLDSNQNKTVNDDDDDDDDDEYTTDDDDDEDDDDEEEEEEEVDEDEIIVVNEESVVDVWPVLVQLAATALNKCNQWPGKVHLLRTARALAEFALEQRSVTKEPGNKEVIHQMLCALYRETRPKRAASLGLGYQAEAFLTFASFSEACGRNAITDNPILQFVKGGQSDGVTTDCFPEIVDNLTDLFVLIIPQWSKRVKNSTQIKNLENLKVNAKLGEGDLELAIRAIGIMWPFNIMKEQLPRFAETMCFLNIVMTQGGKNAQVACLATAIAIFAKLSPEESAQIVESTGKSASKSFSDLGLKELLGFLNLCRESTRQILQSYSNDSIQTLREWASELIKTV
ncbi:unnamed protein product [Trichobilharzia regenti]|nr:unnamed protein product [Trichobilharzia regenti]